MADSKYVKLSWDREHYLKAFWVYTSYSEREKQWSAFTEDVLGHELAHLPCKLSKDDELRVLGVGSGSGELEGKMLIKLLRRYPRINNRAVEPAEDQIIQYKAFAQSKAHELQGVKFDWRQQTLDKYRATDVEGTKFHFISAIHAMYYVDDEDSSMMYLYDLLEPGGKLLVVILSDDSGLWRLWNRFSGYQANLKHLEASAKIHRALDRHNIPYTKHHRQEWFDVTKCLDETSEDGNLLLDFLVHIVKFKETATDAQYREVMEYLLSSECSMKDGDKVLLNNDWDALMINKPE